MIVLTYVVIGLYAVLTGIAGMVQWKETGFQVRSLLFVAVAGGIMVTLFLPNKNLILVLLIVIFLLLHILAIVEGMMKNGKLTYSHHIIRLIVHLILVLLASKFIK